MDRSIKIKIEPILKTLSDAMSQNDVKESAKAAEKILSIIGNKELYSDNNEVIYRAFSEPFEEAVYMQLYKPSERVIEADPFFAEVYFRCGAALFSAGQHERGKELMNKAHLLEPANFTIAITCVETYKMLEDNEEFFKQSLEAFQYAFRPKDIARVYRNLGYFFTEKKLYEDAFACYYLSMQYDSESESCEREVEFIKNISKKDFIIPTVDVMTHLNEEYHVPLETNQNIIGIAYAYGKHFYDIKQNIPAKYFLSIAYSLTKEEQLKNLISTL